MTTTNETVLLVCEKGGQPRMFRFMNTDCAEQAARLLNNQPEVFAFAVVGLATDMVAEAGHRVTEELNLCRLLSQ